MRCLRTCHSQGISWHVHVDQRSVSFSEMFGPKILETQGLSVAHVLETVPGIWRPFSSWWSSVATNASTLSHPQLLFSAQIGVVKQWKEIRYIYICIYIYVYIYMSSWKLGQTFPLGPKRPTTCGTVQFPWCKHKGKETSLTSKLACPSRWASFKWPHPLGGSRVSVAMTPRSLHHWFGHL